MKKYVSMFLLFAFCFGVLAMTSCNEAEDETESSVAESSQESESSVEESKPEPIKLKIGSYNIANGRDVGWNFQTIANDIVENDLDIVGLQEVDILCKRSKFSDTMELLKEYTGMQYYAYFKCIDLEGDEAKYGKKGAYGTAILSKYPIVGTNELELNPGNSVERRVLGCAKIDVNGTIVNFFNTHLTFSSLAIRKLEFQKVASAVNVAKYSILVGDFNVDSFDEFNALDPLSRVNTPETPFITFPSENLMIDNICYSEEFTHIEGSTKIVNKKHSDHVLLVAELEIMPAE